MFKLLSQRLIVSSAKVISRPFKSDLKIKWLRPEKISCVHPSKTGDLSAMPEIDKSQYCLEFQDCKELETADEDVKKQFRLEHSRHRKLNELNQENTMAKVRRHICDNKSIETKIANKTARIRYLQGVVEKYPRNRQMFVFLKEMIDRRKQLLKYLRRWDYRRFEWLLEKLDLEFKPSPDQHILVARRVSLRRLTDIHCDNIREQRLAAYRKELESKQVAFLGEKLKNLEFIRSEQIDCNLEVTVSQDDIDSVRKQYDELKKKREEELKGVDITEKWKMY